MPPFQGDNDLEVFANLDVVDLESKSYEKPSFFEQLEQERELYMLAVIDEVTGDPVRPATEQELYELSPLQIVEPLTCNKTKVQTKVAKSKEPIKTTSLQELLAAARNGAGPMCDHCGATESPQWRKGPEEKPILCNACGTRYRRTQQLGPPIPSDQRKRPFSGICAQQAAAAEEKLQYLSIPVAAAASGDPSEDSYDDTEYASQLRSNIFENKKPAFGLKTIENFFLQLLRRIVTAAAVFSGVALALLAITPTLLSHPTGLSTALNLVNATVPAVTVEVDSLKAGWRQPLEIKGVKIIEKNIKNTGNNKSNFDSKRTLLEVQKIKSTATLLDLALLGRPSDMIVTRPLVDVTMNEQGNLRVLQALQDAGLAPLPRQNGKQHVVIPSTSSVTDVAAPAAAADAPNTAKAGTMASSSLQQVAISIPFSGEIRAGKVHVALTSGQFLAPTEFQELFADNKDTTRGTGIKSGNAAEVPEIHFEVLMGGESIEEEAKLEEQQAGFVYTGQDHEKKEEESSLADWARRKPSVQLPPDVGYLTSPMAVRVDSTAFKCTLAGWRTSAGYTYLASPVEAEMNLTPKLTSVFMKRLNPLLGNAVELRGSSKIAAWLTPSDHVWPSARLELQLSPLRLNIGQGAAISRGLEVLRLADQWIGAAAKAAMLQVDVSPLKAEIGADGKIVTKRVDLAVGVPGLGRPLHFVSFGTAHTSPTGAVNMTLAIPADALEQVAGITGLPADFGVPITVTGTVASPKVDLVKASKELAMLIIESKAKKMGPRSADWMWQELQLGGDRTKFRIPEE
ncbi:hypothetical protein Ndes2526B_g03861 [Nannochloris sp. 'desiccata']